jgi:hypothetical protein
MAALFDHYVIVDWSAENRPKSGKDSIWICHRGPSGERFENPTTRTKAKEILREMVAAAAAADQRMLLGFDFPFGYPAGFAARLALEGPPWRALWDEIARLLDDDEKNRSNRFEVAGQLNRRISGGQFPFWGCPAAAVNQYLGPKHHKRHETDGLAERRLIDSRMTGCQPCWKLMYNGSVGSQVLTGIPVVRALRDDPRWGARARIWPFETGLALPDDARIVLAEIWPSWWKSEIRADYGPPNDKAQVRSVAEIFAVADASGALAALFAGDPNLSAGERRAVQTEEAWTLGVMAPRDKIPSYSPDGSGHG